MQTGTKISGLAHLALISWAMFAGKFNAEPLPIEVREVSIISAAEFAALSATPVIPDVAVEPATPSAPEPETDTPEPTTQTEQAPPQDPPEPAQQPAVDAVPDATPEAPAPVPEIAETPEPPAPQVVVLPEPLAPSSSKRPKARPIQRVAPIPVAVPPPDVRPDEVSQPDIAQDDGADTPQEAQEATAPEAASETIEPEAVAEPEQQASLAPTSSRRPRVRPPQRPLASATPTAPSAPATPSQPAVDTRRAVNEALAEVLGGTQSTETAAPTPTGPPLSNGEKEALRVAVQGCWNVGSLSSEALETTVVVGLSMARDGKPDTGSIRLLSSSGGSAAAADLAFGAARRAIIRCARNGYDLPIEKYSHWREIEMTFNPERMRSR